MTFATTLSASDLVFHYERAALKLLVFVNLFSLVLFQPLAGISTQAEYYIDTIIQRQYPRTVQVLDCSFTVPNYNTYPPGEITKMFASYLIEKGLVANKVVADLGAGSFALGIIAAKHGAKEVVGIDVSEQAIECAKTNIALNQITQANIIQSNGLDVLLPNFYGKVDLIVAGTPWDTISAEEYQAIPEARKLLSRSFYDVEDKLIGDILSKGKQLLKPDGRMFITACKRVMSRMEALFSKYAMKHAIVCEKDIHGDGNMHYVLEITGVQNGDVIIRQANNDDFEQVKYVGVKAFAAAYNITTQQQLDVLAASYTRETFGFEGACNGMIMLVAVSENKIVGCISAHATDVSGEIYGRALAVDPDFQKKGIARKLIERCSEYFPGFKRVVVLTKKTNGAAQDLYKRFNGSMVENPSWISNLFKGANPADYIGYVFDEQAIAYFKSLQEMV